MPPDPSAEQVPEYPSPGHAATSALRHSHGDQRHHKCGKQITEKDALPGIQEGVCCFGQPGLKEVNQHRQDMTGL